nr:MAG TPA: hypothetical protein [Bacteriophage sp.]
MIFIAALRALPPCGNALFYWLLAERCSLYHT